MGLSTNKGVWALARGKGAALTGQHSQKDEDEGGPALGWPPGRGPHLPTHAGLSVRPSWAGTQRYMGNEPGALAQAQVQPLPLGLGGEQGAAPSSMGT